MGLNEWGHDVDAVLFSRVSAGVGPSASLNLAAGVNDMRFILPGSTEVSVRAFATDVTGERVSGALVSGTLTIDGRVTALRLSQTMTPEGDLVYDSARVPYTAGDVQGVVLYDFDRDGRADETFRFDYRAV